MARGGAGGKDAHLLSASDTVADDLEAIWRARVLWLTWGRDGCLCERAAGS